MMYVHLLYVSSDFADSIDTPGRTSVLSTIAFRVLERRKRLVDYCSDVSSVPAPSATTVSVRLISKLSEMFCPSFWFSLVSRCSD